MGEVRRETGTGGRWDSWIRGRSARTTTTATPGWIPRWCALMVIVGLLAACGGDGDAEADTTTPSEGQPEAAAEADTTTTTTSTTTTVPAPPRIVYEVEGSGTVAISYQISGDRQQSASITLPWSEEQAEEPSRIGMLIPLAGSQGDVTCRIRRGDEVLEEQTFSIDQGPLLSCDYPPSGLPQITYPPGM